MKNFKFFLAAAVLLLAVHSKGQNSKKDFYGMWTIEIEDGAVGWLDVHESGGQLDADLLWRGGSVLPVSHAYFEDDKNLVVTRTREVTRNVEGTGERKNIITQTFHFKRNGDKVTGYVSEPARDGMSVSHTEFKGWKLPDVPPAPDLSEAKYGEPVRLFNGKNLEGWQLINPQQTNGFKVIDGNLVNDPTQQEGHDVRYGNLRTTDEFNDFNLKLDVSVPEHSNSGVYLRGMYEIQVFDSYGKELDSHNMGALYSRITPSTAAEKPAGEWQSLDITLYKRHLTVNLNGTKIIDNQPVYGPTGGAIIADVFKPGPIYLQGDHGKVMYRNIVLTPIIE